MREVSSLRRSSKHTNIDDHVRYAPVAGLLMNHRVVEALEKGTGSFSHGQTYQGHPIACAAAAEVQRIIREDRLCENVMVVGKYMEELLKKSLADHPNVGNIRGRGLFWGVSAQQPADSTDSLLTRVKD